MINEQVNLLINELSEISGNIEKLNTTYWWDVALIIFVAVASFAATGYFHNRERKERERRELVEKEERLEKERKERLKEHQIAYTMLTDLDGKILSILNPVEKHLKEKAIEGLIILYPRISEDVAMLYEGYADIKKYFLYNFSDSIISLRFMMVGADINFVYNRTRKQINDKNEVKSIIESIVGNLELASNELNSIQYKIEKFEGFNKNGN